MSPSLGLLLAWGAFAFGAVYPWAYWPLVVGSLAIGWVGWGASQHRDGAGPSQELIGALAAGAVAIGLQALPLPGGVIARLSPSGDVFFVTQSVVSERVTLSVDPVATGVSLAWFLSLAVLFVGATRWFGLAGAHGAVRSIAGAGVLLALVGITQEPFYADAVYGFWEPRFGSDPFGPFINENHFAGWTMMGLPVVVGYFSAGVSHAWRGVRPDWRSRLLWLSSPAANKLLLVATTAMMMGLALVLTFSRSGITCFALALVLSGWFICRRQAQGGARRSLRLVYVVLVAVVAIGWAGVDAIAREFGTSTTDLAARVALWEEGLRITSDFALTGTGMNTYGTAAAVYSGTAGRFDDAHNDYIQIAAEGGLLVCVPLLAAAGVFVRDVRRRFRSGADNEPTYWLRTGAVTGLAAIALQEVVEFSLQIPGNMVLFAVLCAIAVHEPPPSTRQQDERRKHDPHYHPEDGP